MKVVVVKATSKEQLMQVASLAEEIWHECFVELLSKAQIAYMLNKFLSYPALCKLNKEGYEYELLYVQQKQIGFIAYKWEDKALFLSKLYLKKEERAKGYASQIFQYLEDMVRSKDKKTMYLTVNKHNEQAIGVYQKKGFVVKESVVSEIGEGYVMDDYVMEKEVSSA